MKSPTKAEQAERVVVIPEAAVSRKGSRRVLAAGIVAAILGLAAGGAVVWALQRDRVNDSERVAAQAASESAAAASRASAAETQLQGLADRVESLEEELSAAKLGRRVIGASKREARALVDELRAELEAERARMRAVVGPPLADGRYLGSIVAVGASQAPARVVFDLEQWLTGRRAVRAARADGAIGSNQTLHPKRYARNLGPTWRLVEADPFADVVLRVGKGGRVSTHVTLGRLETLLGRGSSPARRLQADPFWIVVQDGRVTALRQQPYTGP